MIKTRIAFLIAVIAVSLYFGCNAVKSFETVVKNHNQEMVMYK